MLPSGQRAGRPKTEGRKLQYQPVDLGVRRGMIFPLDTPDLSEGKALFCVGNWSTYARNRFITGPVKRENFIEIKSASG